MVTNEHVVDGSSKLRVILSDVRKISAKVLGASKRDDLAVIKYSSNGIKHGNSNDIQTGETSLSIRSPLGSTYASMVTKGIISNKSRKIKRVDINNPQDTSIMHIIQTDVEINPGN